MPTLTHATPLTFTTKSGKILSEQETLFCKTYVESLGNRVEAILTAYNVDQSKPGWKLTAQGMASENLVKPHLLECIRYFLDKTSLNDEKVDTELSFLIAQQDDLHAKRGGIDIYNKIKGRYADTKVTHKFAGFSDEELEEVLAQEVAGIIGGDTGAEIEAAGESGEEVHS